MLRKSEEKILNLIKLGPLSIVIISIIVMYVTFNNNNKVLERQINQIKEQSTIEKKAQIKREVESVYDLIKVELSQTKLKIKQDIKNRVNEAHAIANSIYQNNKDKDDKTIQKLIFDALRDIRFNEGRGYFFIYELDGKNVMHPILSNIVGKNLWNFQDKNGMYIMREFKDISLKHKEGFLTWWWTKPKNLNKTYEKIGFIKTFEPYGWYIGSGEYVIDYENALKKKLLYTIKKIRFGKNGYIFVVDKEGVYLSHVKKENIGKNRINLQDKNGVMITKEVIKTGQKGEGYISYVGTIQPTTGKPAEKISFVKGFEKWNWSIAAGVYIDELNSQIKERNDLIIRNNRSQFEKIFFMNLFIFSLLFIASFYISKKIGDKFLKYKGTVENKNNELLELNNNLEKEVETRTEDLARTNEELEDSNEELQTMIYNLKTTQDKLIESEKMASLGGLVAGVAHEINTPVGICLTASTHLSLISEILKDKYKNENMSQEEFEQYLKETDEITKLILSNINKTSELVKSFKQIAVDQTNEEKRVFNLKEYTKGILFSLDNIIKKKDININIDCNEQLNIESYPGLYSQILTNLIINSIRHGFKSKEKANISINVSLEDNKLNLIYKDDGTGIQKENLPHIFDPFFTTNREDGGTGLGLNIIYNIIVKNFKGSIKCNSEENGGVEFIITLNI